MATEITLNIADDGSLSIAEGGTSQPVQSLDDALQAIKQLATAAMQQGGQPGQPPSTPDNEEQAAMTANYRGR